VERLKIVDQLTDARNARDSALAAAVPAWLAIVLQAGLSGDFLGLGLGAAGTVAGMLWAGWRIVRNQDEGERLALRVDA
jgi:hypothetical protein